MKPSEILQAALTELEKGPQTWTKGEYATDKDDKIVQPGSEQATCRCAIGHVLYAGGIKEDFSKWSTDVENSLRYIGKAITKVLPKNVCSAHYKISVFNDADETTYEQVVEKFKTAIVMAKKVGR